MDDDQRVRKKRWDRKIHYPSERWNNISSVSHLPTNVKRVSERNRRNTGP